jgi:hypothetical protein
MLGAIIGDIAGSVHEFNNHRSKELEFFEPGTDFRREISRTRSATRSRSAASGRKEKCTGRRREPE